MLRADTHPPDMRPDYTFDFDRKHYAEDDHAIWHELCERQRPLLTGRACNEYLDAIDRLGLITEGGIPDFARVSDVLEKATNWKLVVVPGLIPGSIFLEHLSKRQFPVTWWIRDRAQMDYLKEPDVFHDLFGHVPMLVNPVFADYMQEWGKGAMKAGKLKATKFITRLYWYSVEFGLINTPQGLRIYGSGIVSSATESVYCLDSPVPNRVGFDVKRIMRTNYKYDGLQPTYFVIDSFDQLFDATRPDFTSYYDEIRGLPTIGEAEILPTDKIIMRV